MLNDQAKQERDSPLLPVLLGAMEGEVSHLAIHQIKVESPLCVAFPLTGKEMYACQTAVDSFRSILETIGGPGERRRGE